MGSLRFLESTQIHSGILGFSHIPDFFLSDLGFSSFRFIPERSGRISEIPPSKSMEKRKIPLSSSSPSRTWWCHVLPGPFTDPLCWSYELLLVPGLWHLLRASHPKPCQTEHPAHPKMCLRQRPGCSRASDVSERKFRWEIYFGCFNNEIFRSHVVFCVGGRRWDFGWDLCCCCCFILVSWAPDHRTLRAFFGFILGKLHQLSHCPSASHSLSLPLSFPLGIGFCSLVFC